MASCLVIDLNSLEAESSCADPALLHPSFFSLNFTGADRGFLPTSFFMDVVAELRQGPAQLRVLRNSPRAMPLSGLPIMVMFARCTSREQGKLQRACAGGGGRFTGANQAF